MNENLTQGRKGKTKTLIAAKERKERKKNRIEKSHAKQTSSVVRQPPDYGGQVALSPPLATSAKAAKAQR
jgi:hypothetical protein